MQKHEMMDKIIQYQMRKISTYQVAKYLDEYTEALCQTPVIKSVCSCNELPDGEIAVSSKALQKPYGDLGQTDC